MIKSSQSLLTAAAALLLLHLSPTTASAVIPAVAPRASSSSGIGLDIHNAGSSTQTYYVCENVPGSNTDGAADPGFTSGSASSASSGDLPSGCKYLVTSVEVAPSSTSPVSLDATFMGRVARTTDTPATWVEVRMTSDPDGWAWGDVSLEMGCDGAATVAPSDGSGDPVGFTTDVVGGAPDDATTTRSDGATVIKAPWYAGTVLSQPAVDYLLQSVPGGSAMAYINAASGTNMSVATNQRFLVSFY